MDDRSNSGKGKEGLSFEFRKMPIAEQMQQENWKAVESAILRQDEGALAHRLPWLRLAVAAASVMLVAFGIWWVQTRTAKPQLA